jgi:hypothetical protein
MILFPSFYILFMYITVGCQRNSLSLLSCSEQGSVQLALTPPHAHQCLRYTTQSISTPVYLQS